MPPTTELLISEITFMSHGYCVLGLERSAQGFRSLRPIPRKSFAWPTFAYKRGDRVAFDLSHVPVTPPHTEDRLAGNHRSVGSLSEIELLHSLKQAETAESVKDLFGCAVHPSPHGGDAVFVSPSEAKRSVCGCAITAVTFSFRFFPKIRVAIALPSRETLHLPLVDTQWTNFAFEIAHGVRSSPQDQLRAQHFFDYFVHDEIASSELRFVRIGLSRPNRDGCCWLMLDSLFPLPQKHWLSDPYV
jgi:hypothetical protein